MARELLFAYKFLIRLNFQKKILFYGAFFGIANCGGGSSSSNVQSSSSSAAGTTNTLTCNWSNKPASITEGNTLSQNQRPTAACTTGNPTGTTFTPSVTTAFNTAGDIAVSVTATCGTQQTVQCGTLTVNAAVVIDPSGCQYQASWCGGKHTTAQDVPTTVPTSGGNCFFATTITKLCFNQSGVLINGAEFGQGNIGCWNKNKEPPGKEDGGYYILLPGGTNDKWGEQEITAGSPNCSN